MLKQLPIDDLKPGMYVNQVLEQSGSVRIRSKGLVKTQSVIDGLRQKGIVTVEVDMSRSKIDEPAPAQPVEEKTKPVKTNSESLNDANDLYMQAVLIQGSFIENLQSGATRDLKPVSDLSQSLIDSVFDNQDALSCLTLIKNTDEYLLEHSINCSILMGMFAQHLGCDRDSIEQASVGALLMDVGMASLPDEIRFATHTFSDADWEVMKTHVDIGMEMVEQCGDISDLVLTIIHQHHERVDGSGYPKGLTGEDISEFARMAAIVDSYDAMISHRPHKEAVSPTVALKRLTKQQGLDQNLVKQFIQCVGVHPVGSLVKLKSGKLGIVSQLGKKDALSPVIMTFYSATSGHFNEIKRLDLSQVDDEIVSGVRPDDFNINLPKFFRDVFIHQVPG